MKQVYKKVAFFISEYGFAASFVIGLVVVMGLVLRFLLIGPVLPCHQDEIAYFVGAQVFASKLSYHAFSSIDQNVARVLGGDWSGPPYRTLFGGVTKLCGGWDKSITLLNCLMLVLVSQLVFRSFEISRNQKFWLLAVVLAMPTVVGFLFWFNPTITELLFATLQVTMLLRVARLEADKDKQFIAALLFTGLCFLIGLFKQNFIFSSIAVAPFVRGKRQVILIAGVMILEVFLLVLYKSQFIAPSFATGLKSLEMIFAGNVAQGLEGMIETMLDHLLNPMIPQGVPFYLRVWYVISFAIPVVGLVCALRARNKFFVGLVLMPCASLLGITMFYTVHYDFFMRITAPLMIMNAYLIVLMDRYFKGRLQIVLLAFVLISVPGTLRATKELQDQKAKQYQAARQAQPIYSALSKATSGGGITTVLYDKGFLADAIRGSIVTEFLLSLPRTNQNGGRLHYTVNLEHPDPCHIYGSIPIHYVMSPGSIDLKYPNLLVESNAQYHLYKLLTDQ